MKADAAQGKRTLSAQSYTVAGEREYGWKVGSKFNDDMICSITGADGKLPVNFNYTSHDGSHFKAVVKLVVELCPNVPYNKNEATIRTRLWTEDANRRFLDVYRSGASGGNIEPALAVAIARSGFK